MDIRKLSELRLSAQKKAVDSKKVRCNQLVYNKRGILLN